MKNTVMVTSMLYLMLVFSLVGLALYAQIEQTSQPTTQPLWSHPASAPAYTPKVRFPENGKAGLNRMVAIIACREDHQGKMSNWEIHRPWRIKDIILKDRVRILIENSETKQTDELNLTPGFKVEEIRLFDSRGYEERVVEP